METKDNFIVAIEIGSSKITGIAGRKQPDGALQIMAAVQDRGASAFIRKGRINNLLKMTACIKSIKDKLEKKLNRSITQAYIGIGGMGMHSELNTVLKNFPEKTQISSSVVDSIQDENRQSQPAEREILQAIIQEYKLGAQTTADPVGVPAESIEGHFLNIITRREAAETIQNCANEERLGVAGMPITVLAEADELLPESERHSGCVFIDMGAETTSVCVFKNNILRHIAVIPLGGRNITKDIASLSIEENEAEKLKLTYGRALYSDEELQHEPIVTESGHQVAWDDFCNLVEARQEEIIKNILRQIELSKYDRSNLVGGLIITGGAASMPAIDKAFTKYTGFEKIQIKPTLPTIVRAGNIQGFNKDGSYNAAIALLLKGTENCSGGDLGQAQQDMFDEKKRKEEEERLKAEREAKEAQEAAEAQARKEAEEARAAQQAKEERKRKRREGLLRRWNVFKNFANNLVSDEDSKQDKDENS